MTDLRLQERGAAQDRSWYRSYINYSRNMSWDWTSVNTGWRVWTSWTWRGKSTNPAERTTILRCTSTSNQTIHPQLRDIPRMIDTKEYTRKHWSDVDTRGRCSTCPRMAVNKATEKRTDTPEKFNINLRYNRAVKTNVGKEFLRILSTCVPKDNKYHCHFNKYTV